jgi:hypothetical protein
MKGTRILRASQPKGVFEQVIVGDTSKPGTCMEIVPSTEPVGGDYQYKAYGTQAASGDQYVTADGNRKAIAVLLENDAEDLTYDDAYTANDRGTIYWPANGEKLNMLVANVAGTGDTFIIGQEMMLDDGTGKLVTASSPEACPFTILETVSTALTADAHKLCRFNGEGGA